MIKKQGNKFVVTNKAGTKVLGTHGSKQKAQKQLAAIEISKAKHMHENKSFKAFRSALNESEYSEVLTGYGNRSAHKDGAGLHHLQSAGALAGINAMLATIGKGTYLDPNEAFLKMKVRLNVVQLDFPWTPRSWDGGVGSYDIPVVQFGRVDGYDAKTGEIRFDGKANPTGGYTELNLHVDVELTPESLYVVTAKLTPSVAVAESVESVKEETEIDEDYQTPARERELARKIEKHEDIAQRGYSARMTKTGKAAKRGEKLETKHDAASLRLLKRSRKEEESPRTYGRGGKLVKRGSRHEVKEEIEQIDELSKGTKDAYVAKRGSQLSSMLSGHKHSKQLTGPQQANAVKGIKRATGVKEEVEIEEGIIRDTVQRVKNKLHGAGGYTDKELAAMPKRVFYPASPAGERKNKLIDSKKPGDIWKTKTDSFGQHRIGAKNKYGEVRYFRSGNKKMAKKWSTGVKEEVEVSEEWKSLKKTKADLNAIRASGKKVSVQHGEGDTLYRVSKAKKSVKEDVQTAERKTEMKAKIAAASKKENRASEDWWNAADGSKKYKKAEASHKAAQDARAKLIAQYAKEKKDETKLYGKGGKVVAKRKWSPVKEEIEQIDELSKKILGSYVKKAAKDIEDLSSDAEFYGRNSQYQEFDKTRAKIRQRHAGVGKAVRRMTKEEIEQIDEAGQAKLERLGKAYDKARIGSRGVLNPENKKRLGDAYFKMRDKVLDKRKKRIESGTFDKEAEVKAVVAKNRGTFGKVFGKKTVKEELVGGQKKLDLNKNKRLDSQDFALLRAKKKKPMAEAKTKQWTPRLDKLVDNRDAVRSKPKKTILTQKVQDGKKVGSARPIRKYEG